MCSITSQRSQDEHLTETTWMMAAEPETLSPKPCHLKDQAPRSVNHKWDWPQGPSGRCFGLRVVEVVSKSFSPALWVHAVCSAGCDWAEELQVGGRLLHLKQTNRFYLKCPTSINCQHAHTFTWHALVQTRPDYHMPAAHMHTNKNTPQQSTALICDPLFLICQHVFSHAV